VPTPPAARSVISAGVTDEITASANRDGSADAGAAVMSGRGWIQEEGGPKREIKEGDVIWTPPGVKHWHGATAATSMSHIAITNVINGKNVEWMEKVGDEQYRR
jgi:gentisate 1,2-dioxygenase